MPLNRSRRVVGGKYPGGPDRLPRVLLTDTITVRPYLGPSQWGYPVSVACLIDEAPTSQLTGSGTITGTSLRIFAPLGSPIPQGSKITLPDGREAVADAVAERGPTAAFPVPSHLEIAVRTGRVAPTAVGAVTITIIRRAVTGRDRYGNDVREDTPVLVDGVVLGQAETSGSTEDPRNDRVTWRRTVVLPKGTDIDKADKLLIEGQRWGIEGAPAQVTEPTLGVTAGIVLTAVRVSG